MQRSVSAAKPKSDLVVAICDDLYRANYPRSYIEAHHPFLVLKVNRHWPSGWPKDSEAHRYDTGPYMIWPPKFMPELQDSRARGRAANSVGRGADRVSR